MEALDIAPSNFPTEVIETIAILQSFVDFFVKDLNTNVIVYKKAKRGILSNQRI